MADLPVYSVHAMPHTPSLFGLVCGRPSAPQWNALHDTAATGATVFGILNPASGPGTEVGANYTAVIDYVKSAGAKVGRIISHVGQIDQIDHDLDHLDPNLPL